MSQKPKHKNEPCDSENTDSNEKAGLRKKIKLLSSELSQSHDAYRKLTEAFEANQNTVHLVASSTNRTSTTRSPDTGTPGGSSFYKAITSLNQENRILLELVKELMRDRSVAQCKGLMLEQIMDMSDAEYRSVVRKLSRDIISQKEELNLAGSHSSASLGQKQSGNPQLLSLPQGQVSQSVDKV